MEIILEFELTLSFYNIAFEINFYQRKIFEKVLSVFVKDDIKNS